MPSALKRERRPPKTWRRNMAVAAVFLLILDAIILAPSLDPPRVGLALVVTIGAGASIAWTWRSNSRLEKSTPSR